MLHDIKSNCNKNHFCADGSRVNAMASAQVDLPSQKFLLTCPSRGATEYRKHHGIITNDTKEDYL
jgi:hypothetical protein